MDKKTFQQLVENVRVDGGLTGAVTAYQPDPSAEIEILSGHHRVEGAIQAGLNEVDVIVITSPLSEERKRAIQLSHNALTGKDDPAILAELYMGLDLDAKRFSGIDDDYFSAFDKLDLSGVGSSNPNYKDLIFHFLPADADEFNRLLVKLGKSSRAEHHLAHLSSFNQLFDTLIAVKRQMNIINAATALEVMAELASERLAQLEKEPKTELEEA